jgi:hypothetical protein
VAFTVFGQKSPRDRRHIETEGSTGSRRSLKDTLLAIWHNQTVFFLLTVTPQMASEKFSEFH